MISDHEWHGACGEIFCLAVTNGNANAGQILQDHLKVTIELYTNADAESRRW
jgi:hypothetical protein